MHKKEYSEANFVRLGNFVQGKLSLGLKLLERTFETPKMLKL